MAIENADEFVAMSAAVLKHPSLEQVDDMLTFLSKQDRDFGIAGMEDQLLDMRRDLIALAGVEQADAA